MRSTSSFPLPPPREWEEKDENHEDPGHRHPPRGVEAHEIGAAGRLRPEVVPPPSAIVDAFDLVFTVRTGDVVLLDDPSIPGTVLRGSSYVRHEASSFDRAVR
jgi:hypothetical protein